MQRATLSRPERRATWSLAGIFALRMLGLFMIYPVFAPWAQHLRGATAATIGLALGIYGLTQALLQIPFGVLSDRVGRKRVIAAGLGIFVLGSVVAALSTSIYGIVFGRLLQGAGAVGSAVLALTADLTRPEHRTRAMAIVGMTIGGAFALAVVVGPILGAWIGVRGIFWLTAASGVAGIAVLFLSVPQPEAQVVDGSAEPVLALLRRAVGNRDLRRLDLGIGTLHAVLTASFLTLPYVLRGIGIGGTRQWFVYLVALVVSVVFLVPGVIWAERGHMRPVFLGAIALLAISQALLLVAPTGVVSVLIALVLFFTSFNVLESILPSMVSRTAPAAAKGTAMGVYSSSQFLGIFIGGACGGWIKGAMGLKGVFGFCIALAVAWWISTWFGSLRAGVTPDETRPLRTGS